MGSSVLYSNHSTQMDRFQLGAWDKRTDGQTDRSIAECQIPLHGPDWTGPDPTRQVCRVVGEPRGPN